MYTDRTPIEKSSKHFLNKIQEVNSEVDLLLIEKAYTFSWHAHKGQLRKSGEPYLAHPVAVALILAEQSLDSVTIAAGLLHDVLEDTKATPEEIIQQFGSEIFTLVDGVTKISTISIPSRSDRQAETYRKMLLSMSKDLRVILIKFADRLHNLRTLKYLKPSRVSAIAQETLDIYAPLANRLGMARVKWELEDLSFRYLHPEEYKDIVSQVVNSREDRELIIERFSRPLNRRLREKNIEATVVGRPKNFYSIFRKISERGKPFEEIYDLLALRVIVRDVDECYQVLGVIHQMWRPIQDRFKDYISSPKSNGYRSIHTTVFGERGNIIEVQIRTWQMHQTAEDGVAAHWLYKLQDEKKSITKTDSSLAWLKNLIEWQKDLTDSAEFFEFFKIDLFDAEIFVFTPKGELITLPKGATVLDFAFAVHTHLGLHCIGARVDNRIEPITKVLQSGATVEVLHSTSKKPSIEWLREVRTPKARSAIRRWLRHAGTQESIELGKKLVQSRLTRANIGTSELNDHVPLLLQQLGVVSLDRLYEMVGTQKIDVDKIEEYFRNLKKQKSAPARFVARMTKTFTGKSQGVLVGSNDTVMVRLAKCCNPISGDDIVGFLTSGRGICIHRSACEHTHLFSDDKQRVVAVSWERSESSNFVVHFDITGSDRRGILFDITEVFRNYGVNVLEAIIKTSNQHIHNTFSVEIRNRNQLKQIFSQLSKIKGIEKISRITKTDAQPAPPS